MKVNGFNVEVSENMLKFVFVDKCLNTEEVGYVPLKNCQLWDLMDIINAVKSKADMMNEYIASVVFIGNKGENDVRDLSNLL